MKDQRIQDLIDKKDWDGLRSNLDNIQGNSSGIGEYDWDSDFFEDFLVVEKDLPYGVNGFKLIAEVYFISLMRGMKFRPETYVNVIIAARTTRLTTLYSPAIGRTFDPMHILYEYPVGQEFLDIDVQEAKAALISFSRYLKVKLNSEAFKPSNYQSLLTISKDLGITLGTADMRDFLNFGIDPVRLALDLFPLRYHVNEIFVGFSAQEMDKFVEDYAKGSTNTAPPANAIDGWVMHNKIITDKMIEFYKRDRIFIDYPHIIQAMTDDQLERNKGSIKNKTSLFDAGIPLDRIYDLYSGDLSGLAARAKAWLTFHTEEDLIKFKELFKPEHMTPGSPMFYMSKETLKILNKQHGTRKKYPEEYGDFEIIILTYGREQNVRKLTDEMVKYLAERTSTNNSDVHRVMTKFMTRWNLHTKYSVPSSKLLNLLRILNQY